MNMVIKFGLATVVAAGTLGLAACGSSGVASGDRPHDTMVSVVASTDVWGDIAAQVAGQLAGTRVTITSIISDPSADPHSYEASTRNELTVSRADVIIENGGGYDDFMQTLRDAATVKGTVLDAVTISGKSGNEHVWYDFPSVAKIADRIADALAAKDHADAATFRANAAAFVTKLSNLQAREAQLSKAHAGTGVAITEPVPLYLLEACGLVNKTPPAFSEAVENDTDVPLRVLQQTKQLFSTGAVKLLAYNAQTVDPEVQQLLDTAHAYGIAVVPVTETLPAGKHYLDWMTDNLAAVAAALNS